MKKPPGNLGGRHKYPRCENRLVLAAGKEDRQDHQIRIREKQLLSFGACGFGGASDKPEVPALGKVSKMLAANARQTGNFIFCE